MSSNTLIEVFGHIVFSFTRGVTEHYNPEEPEFTAESFGYDPLQSTGREWYYLPVDELIYQEYSDRETTSLDYLASSSLDIRVIDACSPEENEETQEDQQDKDKAMAWKRLRPSAFLSMNRNRNHISEIKRCRSWYKYFAWPRCLLKFAGLIGNGKSWDFKRTQNFRRGPCPTQCPRTVTLCDHCVNYDVPGNIHYGWVGRAATIRRWLLLYAADRVQKGGVDDPRD
ncbi:hypothetical protein ACROYT_G037815 [Oculina patagonica]